MIHLIRFFITYAPLVYLALAVGLLFAIRGFIRALKEKRTAIFGLEQEISRNHLNFSIAGLILVTLLALSELIMAAFLGPSLPAPDILTTPTLNLLTVPTTTQILSESITAVPVSTAATSGCITGQIMIDSPEPGEKIVGDIIIMGTADIPNFGFYKYEFTLAGTLNWTTISGGRDVVRDGELGHWNPSQLVSGDYLLQLVVSDNQGNSLPACIVPVQISGQ